MFFLNKKKETKEDNILDIKKDTFMKLESTRNDIDVLGKIINNFFIRLFNIKYHFTFEELKKELNKKKIEENLRKRVLNYYKRVSETKYSGQKTIVNEVEKMKNEFREIIKLLTQRKKIKETSLQGYISKTGKILGKPVFVKKIDLKQDRIYDIIKEIRILINKRKYGEARIKYSLLVKAYNNIPVKEKKQAYFHMKKLYEKLISLV